MTTPSPSLPLVSIVTPAYNEEKYLAECVESILVETRDRKFVGIIH